MGRFLNFSKDSSDGRLSTRNFFMFPLGTFGRDLVYFLFNSYLLTYILFTKTLTDSQFAAVSVIIIAARIFDAFNDPMMGTVIENTYTRWGKFKPWILVGGLLTAIVVAAAFSSTMQGWSFIVYIAVIYFAFSISFTMNDISYWGMYPSLTTHEDDRNKLTSFAQLVAGAGGGLGTLAIPILTAGKMTLGGNTITAYRWVAIISVVIMLVFQLFTLLGVKEKPLARRENQERKGLKYMFRTVLKNDQLMWATLALLLLSIGPGVVGAGLSITYIYFEFGYNGMFVTVFSLIGGVLGPATMLLFPWLCKKFGRMKVFSLSCMCMIAGYALMMLFGLLVPSSNAYLKFGLISVGNILTAAGNSLVYMIMLVSIANTVEYNEYRTGNREEGLIFSLRPFTAKMGSALTQFLVMLVYLAVGVTAVTNQISDLENFASKGLITEAVKLESIQSIIQSVPDAKKTALLVCMCVIPILFMAGCLLIYRKKYTITESYHAQLVAEIAAREAHPEGEAEQPYATEPHTQQEEPGSPGE